MQPLKMEYLKNCFNRAKEIDAGFVGVAVRVPNATEKEIIINGRENLEVKLEYYQKTYDEDLSHKAVGDSLRIVGFTFGNSFAEIQEQLL
jgi:hypothetical protein